MNDKIPDLNDNELDLEYDFSGGVRGKHAHTYRNGVVVTVHRPDGTDEERVYTMPEGAIILDPDLRPYFPDAATVNRALRVLVELIPNSPPVDKAFN